MRPIRHLSAGVLAVCLLFAGPAGIATAGPAGTGEHATTGADIDGICGTLLATGVSAASLGQTVAARGAGWIGAIIAAGCLVKDAHEYSAAFNASPEGLARLQGIKDKYGSYTFEDYMRDFGCTYVERGPSGGTDSVTETSRTSADYWDCSSYGD